MLLDAQEGLRSVERAGGNLRVVGLGRSADCVNLGGSGGQIGPQPLSCLRSLLGRRAEAGRFRLDRLWWLVVVFIALVSHCDAGRVGLLAVGLVDLEPALVVLRIRLIHADGNADLLQNAPAEELARGVQVCQAQDGTAALTGKDLQRKVEGASVLLARQVQIRRIPYRVD